MYGNACGAPVNFLSHMLIYYMSITHMTSDFNVMIETGNSAQYRYGRMIMMEYGTTSSILRYQVGIYFEGLRKKQKGSLIIVCLWSIEFDV
jgi:hypothetical protein